MGAGATPVGDLASIPPLVLSLVGDRALPRVAAFWRPRFACLCALLNPFRSMPRASRMAVF